MAAPTNAASVKKALANSEPSAHDPLRHYVSRVHDRAPAPHCTTLYQGNV